MAAKTVVTLTDDLGDGEASQTVSFAVGHAHYEIDLSSKNAAKFEKALEPYVKAARRVRGGQRRRGRSLSSDDARAIRAWAQQNGYEVGPRGRIPHEVVDAYHAS